MFDARDLALVLATGQTVDEAVHAFEATLMPRSGKEVGCIAAEGPGTPADRRPGRSTLWAPKPDAT
jgi:hypothetical protein